MNKMMKLLFSFAVALFLTLTSVVPHSSAEAQQYQWGNLSVSQTSVTATMYNMSSAGMRCSGQVWGVLPNGVWITSWVNTYIPPGGVAYAYVYANPGSWFVRGDARINCNTLWW